MVNRLRAGFCNVPNPFNANQVARISLLPEDVGAIVFWTRHPAPLMPHLREIEEKRLNFYFQYTILGYPKEIDPASPSLEKATSTFRELAARIGKARTIWRYDPIVLPAPSSTTGGVSPAIDPDFHRRKFESILRKLEGATERCVVSLVDPYRKALRRMADLVPPAGAVPALSDAARSLLADLAAMARSRGLEIQSCAEEIDLRPTGIEAGKCIDGALLGRLFGIEGTWKKDPHQREACGCVASRDIGMYDSCLFGCRYCYATQSFDAARVNLRERHDPDSPSLLGRAGPDEPPPRTDVTTGSRLLSTA